jgi:hypothetical protein
MLTDHHVFAVRTFETHTGYHSDEMCKPITLTVPNPTVTDISESEPDNRATHGRHGNRVGPRAMCLDFSITASGKTLGIERLSRNRRMHTVWLCELVFHLPFQRSGLFEDQLVVVQIQGHFHDRIIIVIGYKIVVIGVRAVRMRLAGRFVQISVPTHLWGLMRSSRTFEET